MKIKSILLFFLAVMLVASLCCLAALAADGTYHAHTRYESSEYSEGSDDDERSWAELGKLLLVIITAVGGTISASKKKKKTAIKPEGKQTREKADKYWTPGAPQAAEDIGPKTVQPAPKQPETALEAAQGDERFDWAYSAPKKYIYCPMCSSRLPEGTKRCSVCGTRQKR